MFDGNQDNMQYVVIYLLERSEPDMWSILQFMVELPVFNASMMGL